VGRTARPAERDDLLREEGVIDSKRKAGDLTTDLDILRDAARRPTMPRRPAAPAYRCGACRVLKLPCPPGGVPELFVLPLSEASQLTPHQWAFFLVGATNLFAVFVVAL
jgi:hypothetical protein